MEAARPLSGVSGEKEEGDETCMLPVRKVMVRPSFRCGGMWRDHYFRQFV